jgi:hypothetical protein
LRGTTAKGAPSPQLAAAKVLFDELRSEERFPLSDMELLVRLDDWDDLSRS